jgi:hypothetical protein
MSTINFFHFIILKIVSQSQYQTILQGNDDANFFASFQQYTFRIDIPSFMQYACHRPGRPGAAEPAKPRQG